MDHKRGVFQVVGLLVVMSLVLAACAGAATPAATEAVGGPMQAIGQGEGAVSIVAWAGYIERGRVRPGHSLRRCQQPPHFWREGARGQYQPDPELE
jgi:hypothetical protein